MRQLKITQSITNRESKSIELYLIEVSKFHPLTPEEEFICAEKIKLRKEPGCEKEAELYFNKLVNSNLRFVVSVAKQYPSTEIKLGDLINAGNEGLIKAAEKFDASKGFKFISYAVWWIRQSIVQYIQENGRLVYLPANQTSGITKYKKFENKFMQEFEEKPSIERIAEEFDIKPEEALALVNLSEQTTFSIDKKISENSDSEDTMEEFLEDGKAESNIYKNVFQESLSIDILELLNCLNEKEKFVVIKFYNLDRKDQDSLENIAFKLSVTKERVRQILEKAIMKLKKNKNNQKLVSYL